MCGVSYMGEQDQEGKDQRSSEGSEGFEEETRGKSLMVRTSVSSDRESDGKRALDMEVQIRIRTGRPKPRWT